MMNQQLHEILEKVKTELTTMDYQQILQYARILGISVSFILSIIGILHATADNVNAVCCYGNCHENCYDNNCCGG
jgi:uncharacterized membrane protein